MPLCRPRRAHAALESDARGPQRLAVTALTLCLAACATPLPKSTAPALSAPVIAGVVPAAAAPSSADVFVAAATAMLGVPYRWGGSAPGGFDCSGLVAYAAARAGIDVPRTAHEQMQTGLRIERSAVRGGDLVFMRLNSKDLHVGIALDGERFVHAPSAGGRVRIDSIDRGPYVRGFLQARRIAGDTAPWLK